MKLFKSSTILTFFVLLTAESLLYAYDDRYTPFEKEEATPKCDPVELEGVEEYKDNIRIVAFTFNDLKVEVSFEEVGLTVRLVDQFSKELTPPIKIETAWAGFGTVEVLNISSDRKPDFVITAGSGGCGFAGGYAFRTVFLSDPSGYKAITVETYDPSSKDYISLQKNPSCMLIQTTPIWVDEALDKKGHYFWVYNLIGFEHGEPRYINGILPGFPKWILYTHDPNSKQTKLLTKQQMERYWNSRGFGRVHSHTDVKK